jgi:gas vesicle protein
VGEEPDRIRAEIEATRAEMSETVDALGYKADVKSRAKESIQEKKDSAKESIVGATQSVKEKIVGAGSSVSDSVSSVGDRVTGTASSVGGTVGDKTPDAEQVKYQARRAVGVAQSNPLGLAIGSVAVGFIAGLLIPSTRVEDEKLGPVADDVKERAKQTGQEALEHGKQVAQDAAQSAQETVKESGQEHAEQVRDSAQEHAQDVQQRHASPTGS